MPEEPDAGGTPIRVQWPFGGTLLRRFEPSATLEEVRAWVVTAYPSDAPTPLTEDFVLKTRPVPGTTTLVLNEENRAVTIAQAEVGGQTPEDAAAKSTPKCSSTAKAVPTTTLKPMPDRAAALGAPAPPAHGPHPARSLDRRPQATKKPQK